MTDGASPDDSNKRDRQGYSKMALLPADEVVARYRAGDSLAKLAAAYDTSANTIKRLLEKHGEQRRPAHHGLTQTPLHLRGDRGVVESLPASKIISEYRDGASLAKLAQSYEVSINAIRRLMDAHGEPRRSSEAHKSLPRVLDGEKEAEIIRRHLNGESLRVIAAAVGLSKNTVWRIVQDHQSESSKHE
jgi:transposase